MICSLGRAKRLLVSAIAGALMVWGSFDSVAHAQLTTDFAGLGTSDSVGRIPAPPAVSSVDEFGIDMVSGAISASETSLSIGNASSGITRDGSGFTVPYTDNFTGGVNWEGNGHPYFVTFGNSTEVFVQSGGTLVSSEGTGNTLVCASDYCDYTLSDGTVIRFKRNIIYPDGYYNPTGFVANYGTLETITKPDGEVITVTYRAYTDGLNMVRSPKTVSSSLGWTIKYRVQNDNPANFKPVSVTVYNSAVDYCDPNAEVCSGLTTARTLSISGTSSVTVTDPAGKTTTYNGIPQITSIVTPEGVTQYIGYTNGRVSSVSIGSSIWYYSYSTSGSVLTATRTNPGGTTRSVAYDLNTSKIRAVTDEAGRTTRYDYDGVGRLERVINPDATYSGSTVTGGYTQYGYGVRNNVTTTTIVAKGGGASLSSYAAYPATCDNPKTCNKPTSVTDFGGVTTSYEYWDHGGVKFKTLPAVNGVAPRTRYVYSQYTPYVKNSGGGMTAQSPVWRLTLVAACMSTASCEGTQDENKTTIGYGGYNVLPENVTKSRGDGSLSQTISYGYDSYGNATVVDGPKSGSNDAVYTFYDELNRPIGTIGVDPDGGGARPRLAQRVSYDGNGRVWKVEAGTVSGTTLGHLQTLSVVQTSTTEYSPSNGLPITVRRYDGSTLTHVTQASYDARLRTDCVAQRLNPSAFGSLPGACTVGATGTAGKDRITKYEYTNASELQTVISGLGTSLQRNEVSRFYNANGTLDYVTDAKGNRTAFQYDNFNRQVRTSYPTASNGASTNSGDYEQIDYSGARVGSARLRDGQVIGFHYDGLGRLSYKDNAVSENFTYNNFNQITSHTANSLTSNYTYNSLGWLKTDAQPLGTVTYDHDGYGRRTKMTYPGGFEVNYSYNDGDELTDINAGGAWLNFVYDNLGRRTQLNRSNGQTTSYGFDGSFRLNSVGFGSNTISLGYNDADQIASRTNSNGAFNYNPGTVLITYGIDGLNRIASVNSANMGYDLRGNFTSDGASTFTYDANNLMTSATQSGVMSHLTYDAENRLHSISKYDTTKFLYDGADIIAEYNGSNQLLRRYVHGPGMDEPLIWFEGSGTSDKRFFHADNQGSIIATTDNAGNTYATVYDEYGIRYASNETYAGRFSYTGQAYLPEIGMYYYKARMYNPIIGRFMQTDPIGYGAGMNWYNYVGSDPVNYTDPWGLEETKPIETEQDDSCPPGETRGEDGICATDVKVIGSRGFESGMKGASQPIPIYIPDEITEVVVIGKRVPNFIYVNKTNDENNDEKWDDDEADAEEKKDERICRMLTGKAASDCWSTSALRDWARRNGKGVPTRKFFPRMGRSLKGFSLYDWIYIPPTPYFECTIKLSSNEPCDV